EKAAPRRLDKRRGYVAGSLPHLLAEIVRDGAAAARWCGRIVVVSAPFKSYAGVRAPRALASGKRWSSAASRPFLSQDLGIGLAPHMIEVFLKVDLVEEQISSEDGGSQSSHVEQMLA